MSKSLPEFRECLAGNTKVSIPLMNLREGGDETQEGFDCVCALRSNTVLPFALVKKERLQRPINVPLAEFRRVRISNKE